MRIGDNSQTFPTSFGEARVRGLGLTGDLVEQQALHTLLTASPDSSHFSAYIDALQQAGFTSFTPPMTLSDIRVPEGTGHLLLDLPLLTKDSEGGSFAYVLMRIHRGIIQFEYPVDPKSPQHLPSALNMMLAGDGAVPSDNHLRFLIPFEMPVNANIAASALGAAASPIGAALEHGVLHILRVKLSKWIDGAEKAAANAIAKWADSEINPHPGMKWFNPQFPPMTPHEIHGLAGKPTLLFVHGIISTVSGAFSALLLDPQFNQFVAKKYGANVVGFDHYTLSQTHLDTAKELVAVLPVGAELDIVCHSRGGAVVRGLLEHPDVAPILISKNIKVNNVIFVAGANAGTPLAHMDNYKTFINVISFIASLVPPGIAKVIAKAIAALLRVVLDMASDLDSLTMLDPDSSFYRTIRGVRSSPANKYMFMRAAYDLRQKSSVLAYLLNRIMNDKSDVVIPWGSAGDFHAQPRAGAPIAIRQYNPNAAEQATVYHTNFFVQQLTSVALMRNL